MVRLENWLNRKMVNWKNVQMEKLETEKLVKLVKQNNLLNGEID